MSKMAIISLEIDVGAERGTLLAENSSRAHVLGAMEAG
jgi:hypothetical protein